MGALTREELAIALSAGADVVAWTREFLSLAAAPRPKQAVPLAST